MPRSPGRMLTNVGQMLIDAAKSLLLGKSQAPVARTDTVPEAPEVGETLSLTHQPVVNTWMRSINHDSCTQESQAGLQQPCSQPARPVNQNSTSDYRHHQQSRLPKQLQHLAETFSGKSPEANPHLAPLSGAANHAINNRGASSCSSRSSTKDMRVRMAVTTQSSGLRRNVKAKKAAALGQRRHETDDEAEMDRLPSKAPSLRPISNSIGRQVASTMDDEDVAMMNELCCSEEAMAAFQLVAMRTSDLTLAKSEAVTQAEPGTRNSNLSVPTDSADEAPQPHLSGSNDGIFRILLASDAINAKVPVPGNSPVKELVPLDLPETRSRRIAGDKRKRKAEKSSTCNKFHKRETSGKMIAPLSCLSVDMDDAELVLSPPSPKAMQLQRFLPDLSSVEDGDRVALDIDSCIEFGTVTECNTEEEEHTWVVQFDKQKGKLRTLGPDDMQRAVRMYEECRRKDMENPHRSARIEQVRNEFESQKAIIMDALPDDVKVHFGKSGFARFYKQYLPVLFLGPFDVSPGDLRNEWLRKFDKTKDPRRMQRLVYWYGETNMARAFSFVTPGACLTYEQGVQRGYHELPAKVQAKVDRGVELSAAEAYHEFGLEELDDWRLKDDLLVGKTKEQHELLTEGSLLLTEVEGDGKALYRMFQAQDRQNGGAFWFKAEMPEAPGVPPSVSEAVRVETAKPAEISGPPDDDLPGGWPKGWVKKQVLRTSGKLAGRYDCYWFSPQQKKKLRSMREVHRFMVALKKYGDEEVAWRKGVKGL